jgi:hypothetical protein
MRHRCAATLTMSTGVSDEVSSGAGRPHRVWLGSIPKIHPNAVWPPRAIEIGLIIRSASRMGRRQRRSVVTSRISADALPQ